MCIYDIIGDGFIEGDKPLFIIEKLAQNRR